MNIKDLLTVENIRHKLQPITDLEIEIAKAKIEFATMLAQAEIDLYNTQIEIYKAHINYEYRKLTTKPSEPDQSRNRTQ
jgi:hypothetical protein